MDLFIIMILDFALRGGSVSFSLLVLDLFPKDLLSNSGKLVACRAVKTWKTYSVYFALYNLLLLASSSSCIVFFMLFNFWSKAESVEL